MKVFVSGASGYIGSAITQTMVQRGHQVSGLARSDSSAAKVNSLGAEAISADLYQTKRLQQVVRGMDVVIHTAATEGEDRATVNQAAVAALLQGLGTKGHFISTSGAPMTQSSKTPQPESAAAEQLGPLAWLNEAESQVLSADSCRGTIVRPPIVYGRGEGHLQAFLQGAQAVGAAHYVDQGDQFWSVVHVMDLARLYALIAENGIEGVFHAAEPEPISMKALFEAIAGAAGVEASSWSRAEADAALGPMMTGYLTRNSALSGNKAQQLLGWRPRWAEKLGGIRGALHNPWEGYRPRPQTS